MKKLSAIISFGASSQVALLPLISVNCSDNDLSRKAVEQFKKENLGQKINKANSLNYLISLINSNELENELSKSLKFTNPDAGPEKIEFNDFIKNNYISKHFIFDQEAFKNALIDKLNLDSKYVNALKFEIQYHNIRRDKANYNDVIFPIRIIQFLDENEYTKGLYASRLINLKIHNMKLGKSEEKQYEQINKDFEELKKNTASESFEIEINDNDENINLLQNYSFEELSKKQINSIFKLKASHAFESQIQLNKNKYQFNYFVQDIDWQKDQEFDTITLKLRVALGQLDKDKNNQSAKDKSSINLGFDLTKKFKINQERNKKLFNFLANEKARSNIQIELKKWNKFNFNFENLKANDLQFTSTNENVSYKIKKFETLNARNAKFFFEVKVNNQTYELTKNFGAGAYSNLFEEEYQNQNIKAFEFKADFLTKRDLTKIDASIYSAYGSNILSGGYDTNRSFYTDGIKTPIALHVGEDYLTKEYTEIKAPFDGEVIAAYHLPQTVDAQGKNIGEGVGSVVMMKVKVANLNLSFYEKEKYLHDNTDGYIYIGFIHLDKNKTLNNKLLGWESASRVETKRTIEYVKGLSPWNTTKVKKGQTIGYVGPQNENGGWMTHVHTTVYSNATKIYNDNGFYKELKRVDERFNSYYNENTGKGNFASVRVDGVVLSNSVTYSSAKQDIFETDPITGKATTKSVKDEKPLFAYNPMEDQVYKKGYLDPNVLFKIRGEQSFSFDIESYFKLK